VRRGVDALLHCTLAPDGGQFAGAESVFRETLSIPLYPALADHEVEAVIAACRNVWGSKRSVIEFGRNAAGKGTRETHRRNQSTAV
jgi:hypothetical protein